jgi:hypothetical protein
VRVASRARVCGFEVVGGASRGAIEGSRAVDRGRRATCAAIRARACAVIRMTRFEIASRQRLAASATAASRSTRFFRRDRGAFFSRARARSAPRRFISTRRQTA